MRRFMCFSFEQTYSACVEQVHIQVYFSSSVNTRYLCSTGAHTFLQSIICAKCNTQLSSTFAKKREEPIHDVTMLSKKAAKSLLSGKTLLINRSVKISFPASYDFADIKQGITFSFCLFGIYFIVF
jgi:hypothetical protein